MKTTVFARKCILYKEQLRAKDRIAYLTLYMMMMTTKKTTTTTAHNDAVAVTLKHIHAPGAFWCLARSKRARSAWIHSSASSLTLTHAGCVDTFECVYHTMVHTF